MPQRSEEQVRQARVAEILPTVKPSLRDDLEPVRVRIDRAIAGQSVSYVEDAKYFALIARDALELRLDFAQAVEQLGTVQEHCTTLALENRELRARLIVQDREAVPSPDFVLPDPFL